MQGESYAINRPPFFDGSNFNSWKKKMMVFLQSYDIETWKVIVLGPEIPKNEDGSFKEYKDFVDEDWKKLHTNSKATQLLYCALNPEEHNRISSCETAKEIWEMLEVTHVGTTQVKETRINMMLHDYELFTMKEGESITSMLDRFSEITNGLASLGKPIPSSDKVKKILRSLPKEWDAQVTAIMESKDLNKMEFSALIGSLINYEIVLKNRSSKAKPKEKNLAFKAREIISDDEEEDEEDFEDDEELALYAKNIRRYKSLLQRRKRDMRKGAKDDYKKSSSYNKKKNDDGCFKCGKAGHYAKDCRVSTSKSYNEKNKKKEVLIATWSDEEDDDETKEEVNLALMAQSSYSSDEEENEVNESSHNELVIAFESLNHDYEKLFKLNKVLKKKNKTLEIENESLLNRINESSIDHSSCIMEQQKLKDEIDRIHKEFSYVVNKFSCGNDKFEKLLSLQRYSLSKHGLGCDSFVKESSLINKFSINNEKDSLNLGLPKCTRCLKVGHSAHSCLSLRRTIKVKKMWIPKGTILPNLVHVTNTRGPKVAWVPLKQTKIVFVGANQK